MTENIANKTIAKNTMFLYVRMIVVLLTTLYTSRILLAGLGVEDYGVYNVVAGFVSMFAFLNTSLIASIQRFYNYEGGINGPSGFTRVFNSALQIQIILSIFILLLVETFGLWYLNHKLVIPPERLEAARILFHCSTLSLIAVIIQVPYSSAIIATEKMNIYAIISVLDAFAKLLIAIIIKYCEYDRLWFYGILLLALSIFEVLLYIIIAKLKIRHLKIELKFYGDLCKSMLKFTGWSVLGAFAQIIRNQGINVILNLFFGPVANAARAISFQIKGAVSGFVSNLSMAARPQIVESYAKNNVNRSISLFYSISKVSFFLLLMMSIPICFEIDNILVLWLGDNIPEYTNIFSVMILVISLVDVFNGPLSILMYASGKIAKYNIITSFIGLMVLPLSYFLLNAGLEPISVYFASLGISIAVQTASVFIMVQQLKVRLYEYLKLVILPCFIVMIFSIILPLVLVKTMESCILRILITCVLSVVSVSVFVFFLGLTSVEKEYVKRLINKVRNRRSI